MQCAHKHVRDAIGEVVNSAEPATTGPIDGCYNELNPMVAVDALGPAELKKTYFPYNYSRYHPSKKVRFL